MFSWNIELLARVNSLRAAFSAASWLSSLMCFPEANPGNDEGPPLLRLRQASTFLAVF
jgi:hypothetical protein